MCEDSTLVLPTPVDRAAALAKMAAWIVEHRPAWTVLVEAVKP